MPDTESKPVLATNPEDLETDYRALVQASPEPVFIHCEGRTVFANPAAVKFAGAESVDQILGTDPIDFVHPDDQEHIRRRRQELLQGSEQLMPTELRYRRLDGGLALVETVSTRMTWRGRDANLVMMRDLTERHGAQQALKESEQRFRDFAASGSDWMWETDRDHRIAWVSEILRDRYELAKESLIGEVFWEAGKLDAGVNELRQALQSQLPFRGIPFSRLDREGRRLYRTVNGHPFLDDAGIFQGFRGTTTDTTADIEARLLSDESQARFAEAIENMNDSLAVYDSDDQLVICNGEFRRFSKVTDEFLQPGTTFEAFLRARAGTGMYDGFAEGSFDGSVEDWVAGRMARHRDPKGTVYTLLVNERWRRIREERLPGGGTVLIGTDVTDETQANLALQDSEAQIRLVTDNIPALVAYIDRGQRLRFVNKPYADFIGETPEALIGKSIRKIRGEEAHQNALPNIERALAGMTTTVEEVRQLQDGRAADWRVTRISHFGDDGEVVGYFVIIFDITEDRQREMQMRQSQKMEVVGQLTGGVAHEFNNLLMVVLGNLELIEDGFGDEEARRRLLETAKKAAIRGGDLTQRLLAFSRRQDLRAKSIDLNELVDGLVDMSRRTLGESVTVIVE
ncbi:MAG: PAS domain S-box protein, partial [Rhodospirillales bacterium]|nr:PAS domain S-box protein [Rhodospirillales bacterium]